MTQDSKQNQQASTEANSALGQVGSLDKAFYGDKLTVEQFESLFKLQAEVLEALAENLSLQKVLDKLCQLSEKMVPNALATIMLLDDHGMLQVKAAPSVPKKGVKALNNLLPGPNAGSCGNVIYQKKPVFVKNVLTDERWKGIRELAITYDFCSC